jgi:hypothetical protein
MAQQLVTQLSQLAPSGGKLTAAQASELNRLFQELSAQGEAGVAAIRDFLGRNEDINFDSIPGGDNVDYATLRLGLLDALMQAGGKDASDALVQVLQTTTDPREIALLARSLEQSSPDQYNEQVLAAARNALAMAMKGQWDGKDVSPLFEVLQHLGDANTAPDLKSAVKAFNYYATLALAGMPNGTGVPTLIQLAADPGVAALGNGDYALRPLAQVALQYPEAQAALIQQAQMNQIPTAAWAGVAAALSGTYIQYGTQIFGSPVSTVQWSNAEITRRIALIDQLLAVTSNSSGTQSLRTARTSLVAKLSA